MAKSICIYIEEDYNGDENYPAEGTADGFRRKIRIKIAKVAFLERIILIVNLILELPSAVFDQLSSVHKPRYALLGMSMSYIVLLISTVDLVHKGSKARVTLMMKGLVPWFYYPYPNHRPFGTFLEIIGLLCAICQCVLTSIAYYFLSKNANNPIKVNFWPIIFAIGLLCSSFLRKPPKRRNASQSSEPLSTRRSRNAAEFSLAELIAATNDFSPLNKIRTGSFCSVYRGRLLDGREVVIKRRELSAEEDVQFKFEAELLSRVNHRHLVWFVGFCEDEGERLLVYEYMKNGTLSDHLHDNNNPHKGSNVINSWKMRIKIALDAARGIEYLHNYSVPPVIHRHVKSSNIFLDADWTVKVSNFGLLLMGTEPTGGNIPTRVVGTVGYLDPEYFLVCGITAKSDVYGLGVVLLELLTGKRAIFNDDDDGNTSSLVHFAVPKIISSELGKILDPRVGQPEQDEAEAVELLAYTALQCVNMEGRNRPTMTDVVANLERSLSLCDRSSHDNTSIEDDAY